MLIVGGGTAAAVTIGALAVAKAQSDDSPKQSAATTTTVVVTATTELSAPVVSAASLDTPAVPDITVPVTVPETTVAETTLPETTLALLPSGAGNYSVTVGDISINGGGLSTSVPGNTQTWAFSGACDGVGDCSISAAGGEAVLTTGAAGSIFSGPGSQIALVPAGGGTYTSTFELPIDACGTATGTIRITVGGGVMTGDYNITFAGGGECPLTALSATFNGTAA